MKNQGLKNRETTDAVGFPPAAYKGGFFFGGAKSDVFEPPYGKKLGSVPPTLIMLFIIFAAAGLSTTCASGSFTQSIKYL